MLPSEFKPLLAINIDKVSKQPANRYMSEKKDGVRVAFFGGVAYSRSLKPLPNKILQKLAQDYAVLEGCDGEVIVGDDYAKDVLQKSVSFCMGADNVADFKVYLFDRYSHEPWLERFTNLCAVQHQLPARVQILEHYKVQYEDELNAFEQEVLDRGGEGVMLRDAEGKYKTGRSGKVLPELQKVKRFDDDEFIVIGYEQFESNENEAKVNELGRTSRSTSKEGKVLKEKLGSLVLKTASGAKFNSGSGFTEEQRVQLWKNKEQLVGQLAKIQFFGYSKDNVPLLPVFLGFRSELDM